MKKNVFRLLLLSLFSACSISKSSFSDASKLIPAEFNPKTGILLVEEFPGGNKSYKAVKEFLDKNYACQFEIVSKRTIEDKDGKYADTKIYPFAFLWERKYSDSFSPNSTFRKLDIDGHFYDRSLSHSYPTTGKYNNYGPKSYIPFFNSIIKYFEK